MKARLIGLAACAALLALPASAQQSSSEQEAPPENLSNPSSAFRSTTSRRAWHAEVEETERGFRIGNPDAEASLIEFISYTCGHCASFAREGEAALDLALLAPGHMNVEVRPVIRNAIDLTVSLLVACGGADGFKDRHRMFLMRQQTWIEKLQNAPQSQRASWASGNRTSRVSMASALDFDDMLAERGMSRADINRCLNDDEAALALINNGNLNFEEFNVTGTPSFALDGELLEGVHNWTALYPVLAERFRPGNGQE